MPDLRPIEAYTDRMTRLEAGYLREMEPLLSEIRLVLLEQLLHDPAGLAASARREFASLGRRVSGVARQLLTPAEEVTLSLVFNQFDLVARLHPERPPDFALARLATETRRQDIAAGAIQVATGWLDVLAAQFLVELTRLRQADEPVQAMADRLLAEDITDGRVSVWRSGHNLAAAESQRGLWTASMAMAGVLYAAGQAQTGERWRKQAVAVIDRRTTDCCLRANGQIQDLEQPFHLVGTPRFRDYIQHPPFHGFCRTAEALWVERFETVGVTTDQMRQAARAELTARGGSRVG